MLENQFITFQRFNDKAAALVLGEILKENNIEYLLDDVSANFDVTFANNEIDKDFRIKLKPEDFDAANKILQDIAAKDLITIDPDYYLFSFTDNELKEIIEKQDEWSALDFLLATKLLNDRGISFNQEEVSSLKAKRIEELSVPEKSPVTLIVLGYVLVLLGGLLGILIGWYIRNQQKTLPNGERIHHYSHKDRIHGERILILGIISLVIYTFIKFYNFS